MATETYNGNNITDTAGVHFIVNGRPFNGTGTGFNELAKAGEPRLDAGSEIQSASFPPRLSARPNRLHPEIALTPNAAFFFPSDPLNDANTTARDLLGARFPNAATKDLRSAQSNANHGTGSVPLASRPLLWKYQTFVGPGDADESYDAPDFQNMALALQTVTPRARGRVVQGDPPNPITREVDAPQVRDSSGNFVNTTSFLRLDLEDLPIPSFFRPDLENYWFHRLAQFAADRTTALPRSLTPPSLRSWSRTVPTASAIMATIPRASASRSAIRSSPSSG